MSTRFLLWALAVGVGAVTACSGATDEGLFSPNGESSGGGADSGGGGNDASKPDTGGGTADSGGGQDAGTQADTSSPPQDSAPPQDTSPPPDTSPPADPGVVCADALGGHCSVPSQSCCIQGNGSTSVSSCVPSGDCFQGVEVPCDNTAECNEIDPGQGEVCCASTNNGVADNVSCVDPSQCMDQSQAIVCNPNASGECPGGTTCRASTRTLPGYYLCLQ